MAAELPHRPSRPGKTGARPSANQGGHVEAEDQLETEQVDVLVVGAGSAGVAAACAAAEMGAITLLVEASGHVGGTLAWQLLEHSAGFHDAAGSQVIGGFAQRLVDLLADYGGTPGHIRDDVGYTATRTPVNHAELALAEAVLLDRAGVRVWLNARVAAAGVEDERIRRVGVETSRGRCQVEPRVVVDCSGDAVVAHLAGAREHDDAVGTTQPASLLFRLGGIDFAALLDYAANHPEDFRNGSVVGQATDEHVNLWGFGALLRSGHDSGLLSLRRTELHLAGWPQRGEAVVNVTRVPAGEAGTDEGQLFPALATQVLEFARWFRSAVPGCTHVYVADTADRIGIRESRRIVGHYTLTKDDVRSARRFPDAIAQAAFPIDIHAADQPSLSHTEQIALAYDIPYRCLVVTNLDNLLVAGRCISTTHEANGSARITATCFATGEAAGLASALAATRHVAAADVEVAYIQHLLLTRGAILGPHCYLSDPRGPTGPASGQPDTPATGIRAQAHRTVDGAV